MTSEEEIAGPHFDVYLNYFREINPNNLPEIDAQPAAHFLRSSGIDVSLLSRVWDLADYRHVGRLDRKGIFIAFKLIAAVQNGHPPLPAALTATLPPPSFSAVSGRVSTQSEPIDWELPESEQQKYAAIFQSLNPQNGRLSGDQVRPLLLNSKLPTFKLGRIWDLSDIDRDGYLDRYEFYVALHLVYKAIQNETLPERLPVGLIHPTKRHLVAGSRRQSFAASPLPKPSFSHGSRTPSISSLNRSILESMADPVTPGSPIRSVLDHNNVETISLQATEADFQRFDTDMDGFVDGADVREPLMQSGLPQHILAKIWGLVDYQHTGRLNHPQFTLLTVLVNECRHGVPMPDMLPAHLLQWLQNAAQPKILVPSSPRIDELNAEIEKSQEERRKADKDLMQLDADTVVKSAEIKNAEIEYQTLSATVKQLKHQKGEASKRLADLDERIVRLENNCDETNDRLKKEEERLNQTKQDIQMAQEGENAERELLDKLRTELSQLDSEYSRIQSDLNGKRREIEKTVDELSLMERKIDTNKGDVEKLEKKVEEVKSQLEEAEKIEDPTGDEAVLFKQFEQISLNGAPNHVTNNSFEAVAFQARPIYEAPPVDPFKHDPFDDNTVKAAFGESDPFASQSQSTGDPFGSDPFANPPQSNGQTTQSNGFANFANFAQFAN
ncbi:unnamed protein product [Bursaphelenchus xylophilus]|uniref:(pine wood nematode) hypothetical protein n=1 Tax=Bursaphelenchus xylophilus TaxID=6326 RepID=A0A1I7SWV4_BURXY|nr:unnamed protein product [Bursaphelenchus xylophilus]CAG9099972.1 unnamed protein product [Bursaphelenchus xylophilus]